MLTEVKLALRVSTSAFDDEIFALIGDCLSELAMLGIYDAETMIGDPQILSCVIFYCKSRFGDNAESAKWEKLYLDKLEKLKIAGRYGGRNRAAEGNNGQT